MNEGERAEFEALTRAVNTIEDATARNRAFATALIDVLLGKGVLTQAEVDTLAEQVRSMIEGSQAEDGADLP